MINPGLQTGVNSEHEHESKPEMQNALKANIYQEVNKEYPFIYLNPRFEFHPGYKYWHSRFKKAIKEYKKLHAYPEELDAQRVFARNIAILQLVPYHSVGYGVEINKSLPSSLMALEAYQELKKNRLIIVPRKHAAWGLSKPMAGEVKIANNIITYYDRAARIGEKVRKIIVEHLG
jgi:hypothetical protein